MMVDTEQTLHALTADGIWRARAGAVGNNASGDHAEWLFEKNLCLKPLDGRVAHRDINLEYTG